MKKKADTYRKLDVTTASRLDLLIKLYQGANDFMSAAKDAIEQSSPSKRSWGIAKAKAIVRELQNTLDPKASTDIARNLYLLYDFVLDRLTTANNTNSARALAEAMRVMNTLQEGWEELAQKLGPRASEKSTSHTLGIRV